VSAARGAGVAQLFGLIRNCYESASQRVTTGELNRFAETLRIEPAIKVYYMTQASVRPPTFVLFTDRTSQLHFSAERYIINRLRERFGFKGTPVAIRVRARGRK
jgi:GTP-binding protein